MAKPLAPATRYTAQAVTNATGFLKLALCNAERADTPKLAAAIRRALKSADGARRHADRRINATRKDI